MQSVPITTKVVSLNPPDGELYLIQHYVMFILSVTCGRSVVFSEYSGFLHLTCDRSVVFSGYSGFLHLLTDRHDITEILLKVALNTITVTMTL